MNSYCAIPHEDATATCADICELTEEEIALVAGGVDILGIARYAAGLYHEVQVGSAWGGATGAAVGAATGAITGPGVFLPAVAGLVGGGILGGSTAAQNYIN